MSSNLKAIPERNDLVIGVISKIAKHGVYIKLIEYPGLEAYCHIREIAGAWIRNIRNFVRKGQQVIAKVIRSNVSSMQVDVSIKRASSAQKQEKLQQYKQQMAALAIVKLIASKENASETVMRSKIEDLFISEFGTLYHGFEFLATQGELDFEHNYSSDFISTIYEVAKSSIKVSIFEAELKLGLRSFAPDGVEQIRQVLISVNHYLDTLQDISYELFTIGSPFYRLWLSSKFSESLNSATKEVTKILEEEISGKQDLEHSIQIEKGKK